MELVKIRELTDEELRTKVQQAGEQSFRIRFQKSMGNLEGIGGLRVNKLQIARAKTVLREREIAAELTASPQQQAPAPEPSQRTARKKART